VQVEKEREGHWERRGVSSEWVLTRAHSTYARNHPTHTPACTSGPVAALANMEIVEREHLVENAQVPIYIVYWN